MRIAVGASALVDGVAQFAERGDLGPAVALMAAVSIAGAAALAIGVVTPLSASAVAAVGTAAALGWPAGHVTAVFGQVLPTLLLVVMALAVVLIGPGAFSVDAHLFGRREIVIGPSRPPRS